MSVSECPSYGAGRDCFGISLGAAIGSFSSACSSKIPYQRHEEGSLDSNDCVRFP
jgi:hypothetical protein